MTAPTYSNTAQVAHLLSDHLKNYAQFLEVKARVQNKLEELQAQGRILGSLIQDRSKTTLYVRMMVSDTTPRAERADLMWSVSDLGLDTGILIDAFVRRVDSETVTSQDAQ